MNRTRFFFSVAAAFGLLGGFYPASAGAADGIETVARRLQHEFGDAVVALQVVVEVTVEVGGQSETNENSIDILGTVIREDGLIVTAYSNIKPSVQVPGLPAGIELKVSSELKGIRVIWPDGTETEATVALNDPDLDLSFIRPARGARPPAVSAVIPFSGASETSAGILDGIIMLGRQPVSMERELSLETGRIAALIERPRAFFIPDIGAPGTPAFHESGKLLGLFANKVEEGQVPARIIVPAAVVLKAAAEIESAATPGEGEQPRVPAEAPSLAGTGQAILDSAGKSVVSLAAIISQGDHDEEAEGIGAVVDKDGLIVTSISGFSDGEMKSIKVITEDGSEVNATVVLNNTDLDLMFLRADAKAAAEQGVEFFPAPFSGEPVELKAADPVLILCRESAAFFRQPEIKFTRVDTVIEEPRRYYRTLEKIAGAPAFNTEGKLVGIYARRVTGDTTRHRMLLPSPAVLDAAKEAREIDPASIEKAKEEEQRQEKEKEKDENSSDPGDEEKKNQEEQNANPEIL